MIGNNKTILVLSDKRWLPSAISPWWLVIFIFALTALPFAFLVIVIFPDAPWVQLFAMLLQYFAKINWSHIDWANVLQTVIPLGLLVAQIRYMTWVQKRERLTLSFDGIRYASPLPPILKQLKPDWYLPWSQVTKAELSSMNGRLSNAAFVQLKLISTSEQRKIFAALWVNPSSYSRPSWFNYMSLTQKQDDILKSVMASEVMRYIARNVPQLRIESKLNKAETDSSLEKNPHGRIAIGIIFLLIIYATLDSILGPESYIDEPTSLLHIYISAGIIGATLSGAWLYKSTLAVAERIGLAMLIGIVVGVVMIPGALRINALTDTGSTNSYDYYVTQGTDSVILRPVVEGMPIIDYFAKHKFWNKFGKNDTYPVQIHKGRLGFYQFNSSAIVVDIRSHENH